MSHDEKWWAQKHLDEQRAALRMVDKAEAERDRYREALRQLNDRVPRDGDGRPIIGMKGEGGAVLLSNWVEPWIADACALAAVGGDPE